MPTKPRTHIADVAARLGHTPRSEADRAYNTRRDPVLARIRSSKRYQRFVAVFLAGHPLCAECERHGRVVPATDVDHIVPAHELLAVLGPTAIFDAVQCQALCRPCHNTKTRTGR